MIRFGGFFNLNKGPFCDYRNLILQITCETFSLGILVAKVLFFSFTMVLHPGSIEKVNRNEVAT